MLAAVVAGAGWFAVGSAPAKVVGAHSAFYEARVLEPAASFVAHKPVRVWCAASSGAWAEFATGKAAAVTHGLTVPGSAVTHLDQVVCVNLRARALGLIPASPNLGASIEVLTHESIHMRGEHDEGVTDCAAVHEMARVAVVYFKVRAGKQLRALMAAAWAWRDELASPYRTVC